MGAVPVNRAEASWERNRCTPAVWPQDHRCGQHAAARDGQYRRSEGLTRSRSSRHRVLICMVSSGQRASSSRASRAIRPVTVARCSGEAVDGAVAAQPAGGNPQRGVEFVDVPAQPVDHPGALTHEITAVIDQQLDLPGGTVQLGDRQPVMMAQGGQRDRFGVDRVGLPGWRPCARAWAISRVAIRTSRCPAASRSRSSRRVMLRQSSPRKAHLGPLLGPAD